MIYVGVAAWLLDIDMEEIRTAVVKQFKGKEKAVEINQKAIQGGYDWATQNLDEDRPLPPRAHERDRRARSSSTATPPRRSARVMAGVTVVAWYPITPSSSLAESLIEYAKRIRMDPVTGKPTFAIVQAEDELAAVGMVLGAGWAGARAMTTTSGPGISLMSEFVGLGYYAEVPGASSSTCSASAPRRGCRPARCRATSSRRTSSRTATPSTSCSSPARSRSATS